jgi:hypothetical protein
LRRDSFNSLIQSKLYAGAFHMWDWDYQNEKSMHNSAALQAKHGSDSRVLCNHVNYAEIPGHELGTRGPIAWSCLSMQMKIW